MGHLHGVEAVTFEQQFEYGLHGGDSVAKMGDKSILKGAGDGWDGGKGFDRMNKMDRILIDEVI
jgi:hypothetical protein